MTGQAEDYKKKFSAAVDLYSKGNSLHSVARTLKIDAGTLSKNLKNSGINIIDRNYNEDIKHSCFKNIASEEQAYWLGFLYADGYVSGDSNKIELCLKDKEHVEKFCDFININKEKVKQKIAFGKPYYRIGIRSKEMHLDLIKNGCTPRKSLTLKYPNSEILPENLTNHFVRGYFDGDGSLGIYSNKGRVSPQFSIISTKEFLDEIKYKYNLPENKYMRDGKAYCYQTTAYEHVKRFAMSLYKNANIYLDRKYKIYVACRFE